MKVQERFLFLHKDAGNEYFKKYAKIGKYDLNQYTHTHNIQYNTIVLGKSLASNLFLFEFRTHNFLKNKNGANFTGRNVVQIKRCVIVVYLF